MKKNSIVAPTPELSAKGAHKSPKNKTLSISVEEGACFFKHCIDARNCSATDSTSTKLNTSDAHTFPLTTITNKTLCGDTFALMPLLPRTFVDLAVVDPPYNLSKNYDGTSFNKTSDTSYAEYTTKWLSLLLPIMKKTASLYICCDWKSSIVIADVLTQFEKEKKLIIQNRITWQREKGRGAKSNWKNAMEDIWFCTMSDTYTFNLDDVRMRRRVIAPYKVDGKPKDWIEYDSVEDNAESKQNTSASENKNGTSSQQSDNLNNDVTCHTIHDKCPGYRDTCPGNFWDDISIPFWSMAENTAHPVQKPEKLIAKLILASSNKGDLVFDPFLGSGTTSVTAKKLSRKYVGIEASDTYCTWAEKRIADAEKDKSIQGYDDGVFWERNSGK